MKKILLFACIGLWLLPATLSAIDTSRATLVYEVDLKVQRRNLATFFSEDHMKEIHCVYASGLTDFLEIIKASCTDAQTVCKTKRHVQLFKIDNALDRGSNEMTLRDTILKDKIHDVRTPTGRKEIRRRLGWMAQFIEERPPTSAGMFPGCDIEKSICLGWFKNRLGATFQALFYCYLLDDKYVWYLWARPATGTVGIQHRYYVRYQ